MENYLYFAGIDGGGGGANATKEACMYPVSRFCGVEPVSATTTNIYFKSPINDTEIALDGDILQITHADTHATAGSYHRCKIIAQAVAEACNAGPHAHGGVVTVFDADNDIYFGGIDDIKGDAGFDLVVTLDA
jgi:hypothetical protein